MMQRMYMILFLTMFGGVVVAADFEDAGCLNSCIDSLYESSCVKKCIYNSADMTSRYILGCQQYCGEMKQSWIEQTAEEDKAMYCWKASWICAGMCCLCSRGDICFGTVSAITLAAGCHHCGLYIRNLRERARERESMGSRDQRNYSTFHILQNRE